MAGHESESEPRSRLGALAAAASRWLTRGLGLVSLIVGLSILASLPLIQVLALGYLLRAGARVSASGRLRDGLPELELFARMGSIVLGFWLLLWIPRLFSSLARSARLIDPSSSTATTLDVVAVVLAVLLGVHGVAACVRGARLRYMLIPRPRPQLRALAQLCSRAGYAEARARVWDALASVELGALIRVGVLGFMAGLLWLAVPTTLLALGSRLPVLALLGCVVMAFVVSVLPFVQLRVAAHGRGALVEREPIRQARAGAPLAMALAVILTVASSLPLYLLKIEVIPREAMWLPGILFVALMLPARLVCGWALHRGSTRAQPRHPSLRALGWILVLPALISYGVVLYFTQYLSWYGTWSLYEQHAFLLPVPFLGG